MNRRRRVIWKRKYTYSPGVHRPWSLRGELPRSFASTRPPRVMATSCIRRNNPGQLTQPGSGRALAFNAVQVVI